MEMPKPNLRQYDRIEGDKIPATMKTMLIDYGYNDNLKSKVIDFSPKGIRLLVDENDCKVLPREILILKPSKEKFSLVGKVIHIIPSGMGKYYLGILFLPTRSHETYRQKIE